MRARVRGTGGTALLIGCMVTLAGCGSGPPREAATPTVPAERISPSPSPTLPAAPASQAAGSANAPASRGGFAAGYDPVTRSLLIEGGVLGAPPPGSAAPALRETWSWNGTSWRRLADGPAQENASMTLDPTTGHLLLIGGDTRVPGQPYVAQTGMWSWNGSAWSRVADNAAEGGGSQAATDPVHKQVLINATGPTGVCPPSDCPQTVPPYQETGNYVWQGGTWTRAASAGPPHVGATRAAMGFDPISSRVIQQGAIAQGFSDETWAWDGALWRQLRRAGADPANLEPFAGTTASDGRVLMMLGDPKTSDTGIASTWTFDGRDWRRHVIDEPAAQAALVFDQARPGFVAVGSRPGDSALSVWILQDLIQGWRHLPG